MYRNKSGQHTFLNAKAATGAGTAMRVTDFQHIIVFVATDGGGTADLTCKCQGSIGASLSSPDAEPTWTSNQSVTNQWDFVHMWDYQNAVGLAGDTGFVVATADDYRIFMINVDGLEWVNFRVTARTAGSVTVVGKAFTNL
jgi:hypothetical protein